MFSFAYTENEPLVQILALVSMRAYEVRKVYPLFDADQVLNFDVVVRH